MKTRLGNYEYTYSEGEWNYTIDEKPIYKSTKINPKYKQSPEFNVEKELVRGYINSFDNMIGKLELDLKDILKNVL